MTPLLGLLLHALSLAALPVPAQASAPDTLAWTATLEPAKTAEVLAQVSGVVTHLFVQEGDSVAAGDTLLRLDDQDLRLEVQAASLALSQAQSRLDRASQLHALGGVSTQDLEQVHFQTEQARLRLAQAQLSLDRTVVRAFISGYVAECPVQVGDLVASRQVLVLLLDARDLKAELYLPADQLEQVRVHQPVLGRLPELPGRTLQGRISRLSPRLDPHSRRGRVEIVFPHAGAQCRPGQVVQVEVAP